MLALALHYLNGWAMAAADGARKEQAEWPPHPDRVFMALAAAHFETDDGNQTAEREVLEWLEAQPAPAIAASEYLPRRVVTHFVPVNDAGLARGKRVGELVAAGDADLAALKQAGLGQLPEFRGRQPRSFPVAIPYYPIVHLIWPDADPSPAQHAALAGLCHKITHIGHSASLVAVWLVEQPPAATLLPDATGIGGQRLRVPGPGRLARLAACCDRDRAIRWADLKADGERLKARLKRATGADKKTLKAAQNAQEAAMTAEFPDGPPVASLEPRLFRPTPAAWQGYRPATPPAAATDARAGAIFDPNLVVFALSGHRPGLRSTLQLTAALRNALMKRCPIQPPPEWLSGHRPDGRPSAVPHVAFLPLPFVADPHADGRLLGLALALPLDLDPAAVAAALGPVLYDQATGEAHDLRLYDGPWLDCTATLEPATRPAQKGLRPSVWSGGRDGSEVWASVTPVVFDRHFDGAERQARAEESVKTACERAGLPRPAQVALHPVSACVGVPHARDFEPLTRKRDGGRMQHSHVTLLFEEPIVGPVLIGAGRFRGYGLCRPLPGQAPEATQPAAPDAQGAQQ